MVIRWPHVVFGLRAACCATEWRQSPEKANRDGTSVAKGSEWGAPPRRQGNMDGLRARRWSTALEHTTDPKGSSKGCLAIARRALRHPAALLPSMHAPPTPGRRRRRRGVVVASPCVHVSCEDLFSRAEFAIQRVSPAACPGGRLPGVRGSDSSWQRVSHRRLNCSPPGGAGRMLAR